MKAYLQIVVGIVLISSVMLTGCNSDSPSSAAALTSGTSHIEGQLVNAGQLAKAAPQAHNVSLIQGVTVELTQNGVVLATARTDEYGRFRFSNLDTGRYILRITTQVVSEYTVGVENGNTRTVYGRITSTGAVEWEEESGTHWDEMPEGNHWDDSNDDFYDDSRDDSYDDSRDDDHDDSYDDNHDDNSYDDHGDDSYDDHDDHD